MKTGLLVLMAGIASTTHAANETYQIDQKQISKFEAIRILIANPETRVLRCTEVELTDKVTLRSRKKK